MWLNTWQQHRIARLVVEKLFGTVTGKRLAILALRSRPIPTTILGPGDCICRDLRGGRELAIHDPKYGDRMALDLQQDPTSQLDALVTGTWAEAGSVADAVEGADAVLVLTEWQQYHKLKALANACASQPVFDARAVVDPDKIKAAGLSSWRVGNGEV